MCIIVYIYIYIVYICICFCIFVKLRYIKNRTCSWNHHNLGPNQCQYHDSEGFFTYILYQRSNMHVYTWRCRFIAKIHFYKNLNFYKKSNIFVSIPNVYPGPLRSAKQPGKAETAQFLQKWRKIRKTKICKNQYLYI